MKPKARFVLRIVVCTVLFIGFLAGTFISGIFLYLEGFSSERLGLLVLSLAFSIISLSKIIQFNKEEVRSRIDAVTKGRHDFITEWTISSSLWHKFLKGKLAFDIKESTGYGYVFGGIMAAILAFVLSASFAIVELLMIALGVFVIVFGLTKLVVILIARNKFRKGSQFSQAEIHFAKEVIILNGRLISLSDFGLRVRSVLRENRFGLELISIATETGIGNRKNRFEYHIPIPIGKTDEANELIDYYSTLIE